MAEDSLKVSIKGDLQDLQAKVQQGDRELAAFKLKAEANAQVKLKVDLAKYQSDLADARRQLTAFRKAGDAEGEIKTRLNIEDLQKKIRDGKTALKDLQGELGATGRSFFSLNGIVTDAIKAFTGLQVIRTVSGLLRDTFNASVSFESAFAGVRKTVEGTPEELAQLSDEFRQLAKNIPLPVEGLARIGELAGQLGIAKEDIIAFTQTIAKLGVTTNLTEEQAATSLARIATIFKQPAADVERFGSSIVALGNNFATTEQEIVNFATNIAGTAAAVGLSTQDIAALGAAFSSVGVEAEAGGTAVQKTLLVLNQAVVNGGEELNKFARISGTTAQDFASLWKSSPIKAFDLFVKGLGNSGDQAANVLDELVAGDVRLTRAFLSLAQSGDLLTRTIDVSNTAFEENNALTKEADTRFGTAESKLILLKSRWNELAITVGDFLVKVAVPVLTFLTNLAETLVSGSGKFATLASSIKVAGIAIATYFAGSTIIGLANGVKAFAVALGLVSVAAKKVQADVVEAGAAAAATTTSMSLFSRAMTAAAGPLGLVALGVGAVATAFINAKQRSQEFKASLDSLEGTLKALAEGNFDASQLAEEIDKLTKETLEFQKIATSQSLFDPEYAENSKKIFDEQKGNIEALRGTYVEYLQSLGATKEQIDAVTSSLQFFDDRVVPTAKDLRNLNDATSETGVALGVVGEQFKEFSNKFQSNVNLQISAGVELGKAINDVKKSMSDDFKDIEGDVEQLTTNLVKDLITTAAKSGDLGKAFTIGYAGGISGPDVMSALEDAGIEVTNQVLGQLLALAIDAKDAAQVAGILHSQGLESTIPDNVDTAEELTTFVNQALANGAAEARAAGQKMGSSSVGGIVTGIQKAFPALSSAFSGILNLLQSTGAIKDFKVTGIEAIDAQINGLVQFGRDAFNKAEGIATELKNAQSVLANSSSNTDFGGGGGGAGGALKEAEKKAKDAEKAVEDFNKQIEETGKRSARLKEQVKEFYGEIVNDIDKAREAQGLLNEELASFKQEETASFVKDTARRDVDLANDQKDIEKEIAELQGKQADDAEEAQKIAEERNELEEELNLILEERRKIQAFINENPDQQATFQAEQDLAGQTQFEQDKAAFDERIAQKEAEVQAEIEKQQRIIDIRQRFLDLQTAQDAESIAARERLNAIASGEENLNAEDRKQALLELGFGELTVQEQLDLLKQAQQAASLEAERVLVEEQQAEILAVKEDYFKRAEEAHSLSVDAMKAKTQELIEMIRAAQIEQQKLNALQRSSGGGSASTTTVNVTNNNSSNVDADAATNSLLNKINQ